MLMGVRMYADEQHARDAAAALVAAGLRRNAVNVLVPESGREAQIVRSAIDDRRLPGSHVHVATEALRKGQTVLSVDLPYESQVAIDIMERYGPVETEKLPRVPRRSPAPLSELLGIPVLSSSSSRATLARGQSRFVMDFFPLLKEGVAKKDRSFGLPLLKEGLTRKDKSFGFPLLKEGLTKKDKSFGIPLLKEPVSKKDRSFGFPMLIDSTSGKDRRP